MAQLIWEEIRHTGTMRDANIKVYRAIVPGGWLVMTATWDTDNSDYTSITFVPDPTRVWK